MSKRSSGRVTKSELQKQLQQANKQLESMGRVTTDTIRRLVQEREDTIRLQVRMEMLAAGVRQALLAVCDAGMLAPGLEEEVRGFLGGCGDGGMRVLEVRGVRIWPPRFPEGG